MICLANSLPEVTEDCEILEDQAHKMYTYKVGDHSNLIMKLYSKTHTVQTQGSGYANLGEKTDKLFAWKHNLLALQLEH